LQLKHPNCNVKSYRILSKRQNYRWPKFETDHKAPPTLLVQCLMYVVLYMVNVVNVVCLTISLLKNVYFRCKEHEDSRAQILEFLKFSKCCFASAPTQASAFLTPGYFYSILYRELLISCRKFKLRHDERHFVQPF